MCEIILVQGFCKLKINVAQFPMNSVLSFREIYIDNFREILMACPPPPLVFLKVLFFSSAGKTLYNFLTT